MTFTCKTGDYICMGVLTCYSIILSPKWVFLEAGEAPLEIKTTKFRMNQEISLSAGAANL